MAAIDEGKFAQGFPSFGPEDAGRGWRHSTGWHTKQIKIRSRIYNPDVSVVLDESQIGPAVVAGLKPSGTLIVNTAKKAGEVRDL